MLLTTRSLALTAAAGLPCFVAAAQHDAVLDRIPTDAAMVVSINNLGELLDGAQAFAQGIGQAEMNMGIGMARGMLGMPGINGAGSAAFVFPSLEGFGDDTPQMVAIVPVTDYGTFAQSFGGTGDGLESVNFQGENVSMKDIGGGYAAVGPIEEIVGAFAAADGAWAQHQTAMGPSGSALAGEHPVVISVAVDAFAETMIEGWKMGSQQMKQMAAMGGAQAEQLEPQIEMIDMVVQNFARDGERGMIGLTVDARGVSVDLGASFKNGSEVAAFFAESNGAADTLAKLPGGDFIAAWSIDMTGAGIRELMTNAGELGNAMGQGVPGMDMSQFMNGSDSWAQVIGYNPAGLMGGLLTYTTTVIETGDTAGFINTYGETVAAMNDEEANGLLLTSSFEDTASNVDGIDAHSWSISMMPDMNNPNAMQMQMVLPMFFGGGANGPSGYVAEAGDDTVVMTYTRTGDVLGKAVNAARNGGDLAANPRVAAQAERLPANSFMVGYVDLGTIARSALPMVGMFAPELAAIQVPEQLTPIAFAASAEGGSMSFRTVVPMDLITTTMEIAETMQGGGGGAGDDNGQPEF